MHDLGGFRTVGEFVHFFAAVDVRRPAIPALEQGLLPADIRSEQQGSMLDRPIATSLVLSNIPNVLLRMIGNQPHEHSDAHRDVGHIP